MFRIDPNPTFMSDVPVIIGDSRQELRTLFRALPDSEVERFDLTQVSGIRAFLDAVVVRFEDVVDAAGSLTDEAARAELFGWQHVRTALVNGYFRGMSASRAGN